MELIAAFTKRFRRGPTIEAALRLPLDRHHITVLSGPSGCGKTTILRCLAGLEVPNGGRIQAGPEIWFDSDSSRNLSPQRRGIGYLFQEYALFPHLTVAENITYGLGRMAEAERSQRLADLVKLLQLDGLESRRPREVSGGQQQRIALARALACRPRLLLLDEPLSAIDTSLREALRQELRGVLLALNLPAILVTHDAADLHVLADNVIQIGV